MTILPKVPNHPFPPPPPPPGPRDVSGKPPKNVKSKIKTVWVVGKYIKETELGAVWELEGVFDSQKKAEIICSDYTFFIGPAPMNAQLPTEPWPGCYYPKAKI